MTTANRSGSVAVASDGVKLSYEVAGEGSPVLFIHEFAGDSRSWEPQVRVLARRYRCITYNARGYSPSDIPPGPDSYSQATAVTDAIAVLDALQIDRAHIVGASMGAFCALHLCLRFPERVESVVLIGCGNGSQPEREELFRAECEAIAAAFESEGAPTVAARFALGPTRVQFQNKDPRGWQEFQSQLATHDAVGLTRTMRGVQRQRPSLYRMNRELSLLTTPILIICGDEDEGCLEPSLMLKRTIHSSGLAVLPKTGHACNLEEAQAVNALVRSFVRGVERGRWGIRDSRARSASMLGLLNP